MSVKKWVMSDEWWVMEIEWRKLSDEKCLPKQALTFYTLDSGPYFDPYVGPTVSTVLCYLYMVLFYYTRNDIFIIFL